MPKARLKDTYPGFSLTIDGVILNKSDDFAELDDSLDFQQAINNDYIELEEAKTEEKTQKQEILVFAEQKGRIAKVVFELLGKARELGNFNVSAVLLCEKDNLSKELIEHGADKVYVAEHPLLKNYQTNIYTKVLCNLIKKENPDIVLFGATSTGRDLAPRIAKKINAGLTADCTDLSIDKTLVQTKPAFGDNVMAKITSKTRPQMSTIRPGVFELPKKDQYRKGEIVKLEVDITQKDAMTRLVKIIKSEKKTQGFENADIIVAGGRGCDKNTFAMLKDLATLINGEVGGSRSAVDQGFTTKDYQIGQTGKTVRPKVYIACGISGAIQHTAGIQSPLVIAINKDPNALIFNIADYGIVADLKQFLPALIKELKEP